MNILTFFFLCIIRMMTNKNKIEIAIAFWVLRIFFKKVGKGKRFARGKYNRPDEYYIIYTKFL